VAPALEDRVLAVAAKLREGGTAVLLVKQWIEKALRLADRVYALARGKLVLETATSEPNLPQRLEHAYFGTDVPAGVYARVINGTKATSKNKRTGSELRHPRESGDPGGLGPRFRGDDVECCLNAKWFNCFWASPN
jgi:ABC-type multidrug transport system ATPase subunit